MIKLSQTLKSYNKDEFKRTAKEEIQNLNPSILPLQQALSLSSYVAASPFSAVILNSAETETVLQVKAGIFYSGIIAGCSCSDDPSPTDEQNEYCELQFDIDKTTAETNVQLLNS